MSDRKSTLTAVLVDAVSGPAQKIQTSVDKIRESVTKTSLVLAGVGANLVTKGLEAFTTIVEKLSDILPDLIHSGNAYLDVLKTIQRETGLTAEQTSALFGAMSSLGIPVESIEGLLARFTKQLESNEGKFRALGVATRDSNGHLLDAQTVIDNLRHAVEKHGESLLSTAAAQELFGKRGSELLPYLQLTDAELRKLNENTARWGGIMSQSAIDGAESFNNTLASLSQGITDIGANIAAALDPYLKAFVDSFSKFVQAHLTEIVNFAVTVVNVIVGFISGLFGITDALTASDAPTKQATKNNDNFSASTKKAAGEQDAFTKSVNAQIKALDAQSAAIDAAAARRHAARERERLEQGVSAARAQLKDLQGNSPFLGGLSAAEQVLAVQKHAQDIIDAKKKVKDAEQSLGDFEADQKDRAERELLSREKARLQDSLAAHKLANAEILNSGLRMNKALDAGSGGALAGLTSKTQEFGKQAAAAFKTGMDAANAFLTILLGAEQVSANGQPNQRVGGVVGAIQTMVGWISKLIDAVGGVNKLWDDFWRGVHTVSDALGWLLDRFNDLDTGMTNAGIAIHNFLIGVFTTIGEALSKIPGIGILNFVPPHASGGWVGLHGPELGLLGEKGPEYIIPNHALGNAGGQTIHMHFEFLSMPSDEQLRKLTQEVSSRLAFSLNHSPVTSLPNGSF